MEVRLCWGYHVIRSGVEQMSRVEGQNTMYHELFLRRNYRAEIKA